MSDTAVSSVEFDPDPALERQGELDAFDDGSVALPATFEAEHRDSDVSMADLFDDDSRGVGDVWRDEEVPTEAALEDRRAKAEEKLAMELEDIEVPEQVEAELDPTTDLSTLEKGVLKAGKAGLNMKSGGAGSILEPIARKLLATVKSPLIRSEILEEKERLERLLEDGELFETLQTGQGESQGVGEGGNV